MKVSEELLEQGEKLVTQEYRIYVDCNRCAYREEENDLDIEPRHMVRHLLEEGWKIVTELQGTNFICPECSKL